MRKQQRIWRREHAKQSMLPALASVEPQMSINPFVEYLTKHCVSPLSRFVDIGCGKGRNAIYLATLGYEVYGFDYIQCAIDAARQLAERRRIFERVHFSLAEMDKPWPFANAFFDGAIDCFSSIDIETLEGRMMYKQEMYRTLKPGGYALVTVVSVKDEIEHELIKQYPGKEKNSTVWPGSGKFQKDYDEEELREFYQEFCIAEFKEIKHQAFKLDRKYTATDYWIVLRKC